MIDTVQDLLTTMKGRQHNPRALNQQNATTGEWESFSTEQCLELIQSISAGLTALGVKQGDKIGILSPPSAYWTLCDMAIMQMGCVSVPIFFGITEDQVMYEVEHSEVKVIFVSGILYRQMCAKTLGHFKHVISLDETGLSHELVFKEFINVGREYRSKHSDLHYEVQGSDLATIVYTSGTTTLPKGVELTHLNMMCELINGENRMKWGGINERYLNYLPMAHIFGRLVNQSLFFSNGCIYYLNDPSMLIRACQEIQPTVLVFIPRVLEKAYNTIRQKVEHEKNPIKRALASWAFKRAQHEHEKWYDGLLNYVADKILYQKIRDFFGGHLSKPIAGSAKSNPAHFKFFHHAGISIVEGYGLTEACPAITNIPGKIHFDCLGYPMPDVEVKLSDQGEIMLRGNVVMRGYHKNPEATAAAIEPDGWLHTGDFGEIDPNGVVKFLYRKTEICKSSYGEFVNLNKLEMMIKELPFIDGGVVIAENRPIATALLFIDCDGVELLKERLGLKNLSNEEVMRTELVKKQFETSFRRLNDQLNPWERIRGYRFIFTKMTVAGGELSPTMKQKRNSIEEKYKDLVEEMYPEKIMHLDLKK